MLRTDRAGLVAIPAATFLVAGGIAAVGVFLICAIVMAVTR